MLGSQEIPCQNFGDIIATLWSGGIPKSTWKDLENVQKDFIQSFSKSRNKRYIISYFLRQDHLLLRSYPWKGL